MGHWPKRIWDTAWRVLLLAAIALGPYAFWVEPSDIYVIRHDIGLDRADAQDVAPLHVAVIGDLHAGAPYIDIDKIHRIVALTNAARPDVVLLTGDYVVQHVLGGRHIEIERIAPLLGELRAPLGVFAVLGNHDHWENGRHIAAVLEASGIRVLDNRSVALPHGKSTLYLVGIGDRFSNADNQQLALRDVPRDKAALCFTHSPDVFPDLPRTCLLTVAAHTHGGQIWLPFVGRMIVPSKFGQRYAAGLVHEDGRYLFVTTGIGTSILPVRFRVPPEISILDVSAR
jgi:predicted MPP superfamily phosphohydrolase